jgi:hypothetical protein
MRQIVGINDVINESVETCEDFFTSRQGTLDFGSLAGRLGKRLFVMIQERVERDNFTLAVLTSELDVIPS